MVLGKPAGPTWEPSSHAALDQEAGSPRVIVTHITERMIEEVLDG
jgi:hypothetical protein